MPIQKTLLDGDTGSKFDSLNLKVGEALIADNAGTLLAPGTYPLEPLIWDGAEWAPSSTESIAVSTVYSSANIQTTFNIASAQVDLFVDTAHCIEVQYSSGTALQTLSFGIGLGGSCVQCEAPDALPLRVGFLGARPVARQSITGATTQDQVDSIVAAGVALGLWTDNR